MNENTDNTSFEYGHIKFEQLPNTRDLGYLQSASGVPLVSKTLLRSGSLSLASAKDIDKLKDTYHLKTVIDLRTDEEKEKAPDPKAQMSETTFIDAPILGFSTTGLTRENGIAGMVKAIATLKRDPKKIMIELYPNMLLDETGIEGFKLFFETLLDAKNEPILWHCSAGKDRAGLATVLLLHVLEVPWDAILSDYLATNQYIMSRTDDLKELVPEKFLTESVIRSLGVFNSADESFLNAGIAAVEDRYGSLDGYLGDALGITSEARLELQNRYLENH